MTDAANQAGNRLQDDGERERLLVEQLPQVRYIARCIHERLPRHVLLEDMVHAGVLGLMDALQNSTAANTCSLVLTPSSASAGQFSTVCGKWTGARAICGARRDDWKRRTIPCALQPGTRSQRS
jgi:hypothetical protein